MLLIKPKKNRKKGFTLIELIVVVAIIAILAAVAVPSFIGLQARAQRGVDVSNASALCGAVNVFNAMTTDSTKLIVATSGITQTALGDLWPSGIPATVPANVLKRITMVAANGGSSTTIATVGNTDTSKDPT